MLHLLTDDEVFPSRDDEDSKSLIFYLQQEAAMIASCRVTELEVDRPFLAQLKDAGIAPEAARSVVVGRLVVAKGSRGSGVYSLLLANVCQWVIQNTEHLYWYAKCNPALAGLYARLGASTIANRCIATERHGTLPYVFLMGSIRETSKLAANALHAKGMINVQG